MCIIRAKKKIWHPQLLYVNMCYWHLDFGILGIKSKISTSRNKHLDILSHLIKNSPVTPCNMISQCSMLYLHCDVRSYSFEQKKNCLIDAPLMKNWLHLYSTFSYLTDKTLQNFASPSLIYLQTHTHTHLLQDTSRYAQEELVIKQPALRLKGGP